jgi:outer membrane protein assembly factor BamB
MTPREKTMRLAPIFILLAVHLAASSAVAADWPQFRGGTALGRTAGIRLPLEWSSDRNVAWKTPIPGAGWSQPIVAGGRIFVTTAVSPGNDKPSGMMGGVMSLTTWGIGSSTQETFQWRVLALDPADGKILWSRTVAEARPKNGKHASNTYATETPCGSATAVHAFFGATGTLVSLDHEGNERWRRELGPQPIQNQFGTGSSPVLHETPDGTGRLFVQLYNEDDARLLCIDATTGADVWVATRDKGTAWSTPVVWTNDGVAEVITAGQGSVIAYALDTGVERWRLAGLDTSFACSVVADGDGVYFGTSSPGSKAPAYSLAAGCRGDLTLPKGQTKGGAVRWSRNKSGAGMPSPVVVGDHLYFFDKTAVCYDKRTGEEKYRKRLPGGGTSVGSPLVVGDRIYLVNERGRTVVLQAGPEFKVLAEPSIGDGDEIFWATPAVADDALLIRSSNAVYCIRSSP